MSAALFIPPLQKGGEGGFADADVRIRRFQIPLGPLASSPPLPAGGSLRSSGTPTGVPLAGKKGEAKIAAVLGGAAHGFTGAFEALTQ
jgi:hypothetical protein